MQDGGVVEDQPGISFAGLGGEHEARGDQEDNEDHLEGGREFLAVTPLQDIVHGVQEDDRKDIRQGQDEQEGAVNVPFQGDASVAEDHGDQEGERQHDLVQDDEVQVLGPSLCISLIQSVVLLLFVMGGKYVVPACLDCPVLLFDDLEGHPLVAVDFLQHGVADRNFIAAMVNLAERFVHGPSADAGRVIQVSLIDQALPEEALFCFSGDHNCSLFRFAL